MQDKNLTMAKKIAEAVSDAGGRAYFVGGWVRDEMIGVESKDVDLEIHGICADDLLQILSRLGDATSYGESFGIYALRGYDLDISLPRMAGARGGVGEDFENLCDPFVGTEKAAKRRDFTVNAMMKDVLTGEVLDYFGGRDDLRAGILRHVDDEGFCEDPLRVFRAASLAARLNFRLTNETTLLCSKIDTSKIARERVFTEISKALLKAERPSIFFENLRKMNQLSTWLPELEALIGVEQNPKYHAEGDVFVHTMMVIDQAAKLIQYADNKLGYMFSAVAHDFGKANCTEIVGGEIHCYGHEIAGLEPTKSFMKRLTDDKELTKCVLNLCEFHMKPNQLAANRSAIKSTNKMLDSSLDPKGLICLAIADGLGKESPNEYVSYNDFFIERYQIYLEYMSRPYVTGKDLIEAGLAPSESFSDCLAYAHKLRLAGIEKNSALRQTLAYARKKH